MISQIVLYGFIAVVIALILGVNLRTAWLYFRPHYCGLCDTKMQVISRYRIQQGLFPGEYDDAVELLCAFCSRIENRLLTGERLRSRNDRSYS